MKNMKTILLVAVPVAVLLVAGGVLITYSSGFFGSGGAGDAQQQAMGSESGEESEYTANKTVAETSPAVASETITGGSGASEQGLSAHEAIEQSGGSETISNLAITAASADESGVKVSSSGSLTLTNCTITTSGSATNVESSNFTGENAGVLATDGAVITLIDCTIVTSGEGANAVFATGEDSKIICKNVKIETSADSARGLDATYGGTVEADGVTITTKGAHCGALATDRGEGTVTVNNAVLNTAGDGSPVVYSTGNITLTNAVGVAAGAEACVIEGSNSIVLAHATLTSASKYGVMIYQSFSGDAGVGEGTFTASDSTITALIGPLFYATNTTATINLDNCTLDYDSGVFAAACEDRWGKSASNGAQVTLAAHGVGDIGATDVDDSSSITIND